MVSEIFTQLQKVTAGMWSWIYNYSSQGVTIIIFTTELLSKSKNVSLVGQQINYILILVFKISSISMSKLDMCICSVLLGCREWNQSQFFI